MQQIQQLKITTEYIRLCDALKFSGIASTGGQAKILIETGEIRVNGEPCNIRGKKLRPGDIFAQGKEIFEIVA